MTPWTIAQQVPLSMGFPRQEFWSGLPFPSPGDLPDPGMEPKSPALADGFFKLQQPPGKLNNCINSINCTNYRVHGILQARILEWVTFPFCRGSSQPRDQTQVDSFALQVDSLPAEPQGKPNSIIEIV